jgi:branched-subunit amino acid aminotransferase/4-amino-4-deoxychorismate lyase
MNRGMRTARVVVNGEVLPAEGTHLSAWDRGFQLGDGVFETLRARAGHAVELAAHLQRLRQSMAALAIDEPAHLEGRLEADISRLLDATGLAGPDGDAAVRITVSRGASSGRGILPPEGLRPTIVIQAWPMQPLPKAYLDAGLHVIVSTVRRDPEHPLVNIKSTSRAETVVARLEAHRAGADDALFLTADGYLSEATSANVFVVRSGVLSTPDLRCAILPGTTRSWLLRWATEVGLQPVEDLLTTRDLAEADEAFLSSSIAGVIPVTRLEGTAIGTGRPGPWTRRARAAREACFAAGAFAAGATGDVRPTSDLAPSPGGGAIPGGGGSADRGPGQ